MVPDEERVSAYVGLNRDFSDRLDGRLELHVTNNHAIRFNSPSFPKTERTPISVNHPDNPYGTDVLWIGRIIGGGGTPSLTTHDSRTWRVAASLTGDFNDRWGWDAGFQRSKNNFIATAEDTVGDRMRSALAGLGGPNCDPSTGTPGVGNCHYLNPFGSALTGTGTVNPPELIDYIQGPYDIDATARLTSLDGVVTGELGELAGGPAGLAVGVQLRNEESHSDYSEIANRDGFMFVVGNPDFAGSRDVTAAFVELLLPVSDALDVQLAARIEDYGGGLDSADPKMTLLWRPSDSFAVRGPWARRSARPRFSRPSGHRRHLRS